MHSSCPFGAQVAAEDVDNALMIEASVGLGDVGQCVDSCDANLRWFGA